MQQPTLPDLELRLQDDFAMGNAASSPSGAPFFRVLGSLLRRPQRVIVLWNWKAAWLSLLLRGPIFLAASVRRGFRVTIATLLIECVFCMSTAGFYGAFVQSLRDATPEWLTILFLTVAMPAVFQVLEYAIHLSRGTPHLRIVELVSIVVSGISSLFNWYAMRRGALLVGGEGGSFTSDLRRLPGLILKFALALPRWMSGRNSR